VVPQMAHRRGSTEILSLWCSTLCVRRRGAGGLALAGCVRVGMACGPLCPLWPLRPPLPSLPCLGVCSRPLCYVSVACGVPLPHSAFSALPGGVVSALMWVRVPPLALTLCLAIDSLSGPFCP